MIITRQYGRKLVRRGKATEQGLTTEIDGIMPGPWPRGFYYVVINRLDQVRTDHYLASKIDIGRLLS